MGVSAARERVCRIEDPASGTGPYVVAVHCRSRDIGMESDCGERRSVLDHRHCLQCVSKDGVRFCCSFLSASFPWRPSSEASTIERDSGIDAPRRLIAVSVVADCNRQQHFHPARFVTSMENRIGRTLMLTSIVMVIRTKKPLETRR